MITSDHDHGRAAAADSTDYIADRNPSHKPYPNAIVKRFDDARTFRDAPDHHHHPCAKIVPKQT
jgi:hypothetical protein